MLREAANTATSPRDPGLDRATWWLVSLSTQVGGAALALGMIHALDQHLGRDTLRDLRAVMGWTGVSVMGGLLVCVLVTGRVSNVRGRDDVLLVDVAAMFAASSVVILATARFGWGALAAVAIAVMLPLAPSIVGASERVQDRLGTPEYALQDNRADTARRVAVGVGSICLPVVFLTLVPRMSDTMLNTVGGMVVLAEVLVAFGAVATSLIVRRTWLVWLIGVSWMAYWGSLAALTFQRLGDSVG